MSDEFTSTGNCLMTYSKAHLLFQYPVNFEVVCQINMYLTHVLLRPSTEVLS